MTLQLVTARDLAELTEIVVDRALPVLGADGGAVAVLADEDVLAYFRSRPWASRVGAHASAQSRPVADRETLETAYRESAERFPDTGSPEDVPVPQDWGGYRLVVDRVELWAGRRSRLHDRIGISEQAPAAVPALTLR